jgi:hypothetical protein
MFLMEVFERLVYGFGPIHIETDDLLLARCPIHWYRRNEQRQSCTIRAVSSPGAFCGEGRAIYSKVCHRSLVLMDARRACRSELLHKAVARIMPWELLLTTWKHSLMQTRAILRTLRGRLRELLRPILVGQK